MQNKEKYKHYPKYKASEVGWIGEIPDEWKGKRFRFLFSFNNGLNITKENLQDEGIPCVSYGEIHSKYGFQVDPEKNELKCVDKKYIETSSKSLLKYGDFVFADTSEDIEGSGNFTYLNGNSATFAGYHTIITRPVENFIHRYVAYLFDSLIYRTQIRSEVSGIKVYSITKNILKDTIVILPPIPEQQAIATFLDRETDRINGIITKQTQMIDLLKEKRSALITQAVTKGLDPNAKMKSSGVKWIGEIPEKWEIRKFSRNISKIKDGTHGSFTRVIDGYPLLSAKNVDYGKLILEDNESTISEDDYKLIIANGFPQKNDLLLTIVGTIGRCLVYQEEHIYAFQRSVAFLRDV